MRVVFERLTKQFGSHVAIDDLSLTIEPGQVVAVVGMNGAGKSTLLRLLATILAPSQGRIHLDHQSLDRGRLDLRRRLALLPDVPPVPAHATPIHYISTLVAAYEAQRPGLEELVAGLLDELDLLPLVDTRAGEMSRGQVYKVALAGVVAVAPDLWLCDEPFASGMDPQGLAAFRKYAQKTAGRGGTVIYSTQILELAEQFSDCVLILDGGRLHAFGPVETLRDAEEPSEEAVLGRIFAGLHSAAR